MAKGERKLYDPTKNIRKELKEILNYTTPVVSDVMNRQGAMYGVNALFQGMKMVGPAFTLRTLHGDWLWVCKACDAANRGDVLVIDMGGTSSVAVWGDLSAWGFINRGGVGVVVDGGVRDLEELRKIGLPTYYRAIVPNAGNPHEDGGATGIPIQCGGQPVRPGDIIFGDDSGVVVVPKERYREILKKCRAQEALEAELLKKIRAGAPTLSYNR
ncbi:MAG: RraA family protein [Candidatus Bathyarchaeia archaeon]